MEKEGLIALIFLKVEGLLHSNPTKGSCVALVLWVEATFERLNDLIKILPDG